MGAARPAKSSLAEAMAQGFASDWPVMGKRGANIPKAAASPNWASSIKPSGSLPSPCLAAAGYGVWVEGKGKNGPRLAQLEARERTAWTKKLLASKREAII
jgi:hypothetical protein